MWPSARSTNNWSNYSVTTPRPAAPSSRARFEIELLEKRDDIPAHLLEHARRQRAAAETRCARLLTAIEALEDRLENE